MRASRHLVRLTHAVVLLMLPLSSVDAQFGLFVSEVDYDQVGVDNAEWVEIWNSTDDLFVTAGISLVLYDVDTNGACVEYCRVDLSPLGALVVDQYIVIGAHPCASLPLCTSIDAIQNGSPDAIALENESGEAIFSVEYASDLGSSECDFSQTTVTDNDSTSGSIQLLCGLPGFQFLSSLTPCAGCPTPTDVPDWSPVHAPWGTVKELFK